MLTVIADYGKRGNVGWSRCSRSATGELANRMVEVEYGNEVGRRPPGARSRTAGWCWSPATTRSFFDL